MASCTVFALSLVGWLGAACLAEVRRDLIERRRAQHENGTRSLACDPELTGLFTPRRPQVGRYQVCTTGEPIGALVAKRGPEVPHYGPVEAREPLDVFGWAGPYNRTALARLYGGRRAQIAHGWVQRGDRFESLTLVSPFPDAALAHLSEGTMVIALTLSVSEIVETAENTEKIGHRHQSP